MEERFSIEDEAAVAQAVALFDWDKTPLLPVATQDAASERVLMVAFMNRDAFAQTVRTGRVHYYSRSRDTLWLKGETSGHYQLVQSLHINCEENSLLARITQVEGTACHTGHVSCYYRRIDLTGALEED